MTHWRSMRPRGRLLTDHARRLIGDVILAVSAIVLICAAWFALRLIESIALALPF